MKKAEEHSQLYYRLLHKMISFNATISVLLLSAPLWLLLSLPTAAAQVIILDVDQKLIDSNEDSISSSRCEITEKSGNSNEKKTDESFRVWYFYTVETSTAGINFLPALEEAIFSSISNILVLCYGSPAMLYGPNLDSLGKNLRNDDGNIRKLLHTAQHEIIRARELIKNG